MKPILIYVAVTTWFARTLDPLRIQHTMNFVLRTAALVGAVVFASLLTGTAADNGCLSNVENRERELWMNLEQALQAPDGIKYFDQNVRDAVLPPLRGTVTLISGNDHPDRVWVAVSDANAAEITLQAIAHLPRKSGDRQPAVFENDLRTGDVVEFTALGRAFVKDPFMLTFDVAVADLRRCSAR